MIDIKGETELLPVDDIRHCPDWLRISDQIKSSTRTYSTKNGGYKIVGRKVPSRRVFVRAYRYGVEVMRGTYKDVYLKTGITVDTIRNYVSNGNVRRDGYSFKVLPGDQVKSEMVEVVDR